MSDAKSGLTTLMSDRGSGGYASNVDWLVGRGGAGGQADATQLLTLSDALGANSNATALLNAAVQAQSDALAANTKALSSTSRQAGSEESKAASVAKTVAGGLFGGLTLAPLVRGLFSLFGGGGDGNVVAPALPRYEAPTSVDMAAGVTSAANSPVAIDYDQTGRARAVQAPASPAQITVNVHAMDSQSFLDRSDDIARAVKKAMLESNSLNDVIAEL